MHLYGYENAKTPPRSEFWAKFVCIFWYCLMKKSKIAVTAKHPLWILVFLCIYPQILRSPYHNNAVWLLCSLIMPAAAKAGNEEAVMESISAVYRPAAL